MEPLQDVPKRDDRPEWRQNPRWILVRQRARLGPSYYVLRPFAIAYAILFRALLVVLAVAIYVGWWVFWLLELVLAQFFGVVAWTITAYARLRHGRAAAD